MQKDFVVKMIVGTVAIEEKKIRMMVPRRNRKRERGGERNAAEGGKADAGLFSLFVCFDIFVEAIETGVKNVLVQRFGNGLKMV